MLACVRGGDEPAREPPAVLRVGSISSAGLAATIPLTTQPSVAVCVDTLADLTCQDPIGDLEACLLAVDGDRCRIPTTR